LFATVTSLGVVAPDQLTATRAANAIAVHWKTPGQQGSAGLSDYLKKCFRKVNGVVAHGRSVSEGLKTADKTLEQSYTVAYIAHAPT
jgi:hypothetical protein